MRIKATSEHPSPGTSSGPAEVNAEAPPVLKVIELARLLRVNPKTVYASLSRGDIPGARRIGGAWRIHRDAVLRWIASGQGCDARPRRNP